MGFIQNLFNNKPLGLALGESVNSFTAENRDEIKSVFAEIKEDADAIRSENSSLKHFAGTSIFAYSYAKAIGENENLKDLLSEGWNNLKGDMKTWAQEEHLIGDIVNYFNEDKNVEEEG